MSGDRDPVPRSTTQLINKIEELRDKLIQPLETLLRRAGDAPTDRNTTAVNEYHMQIEIATMVKAAEDFQVLVRQLQEMWLFGQLDTLGESKVQLETDENARVVAGLLQRLAEQQNLTQSEDKMEDVAAKGSS